jgi:hypothetical protein
MRTRVLVRGRLAGRGRDGRDVASDGLIATAAGGVVERRIVVALRVGVPAVIIGVFLWRIFPGADPVDRLSDDFFYYLVPAQNWVDGAGSVYFPGEPTNGYHPLWFLWVALLYLTVGYGSVFFALLDLSVMALMIGFYFLFERFLRRLTGERLGAAVGTTVATVLLVVIAFAGVETALVAFAAALLLDFISRKPLAEQTVRDAAVVGLLGAFLVLSRLDAVMLTPGLLVAVVPRWDWKRLAAAAAGAAPLYLYLVFNVVVFGHVETTSMAAKSMGFYWPPNWYFIATELPLPGGGEALALVAALVIAVLVRRVPNTDMRRIALALAAAPLLQFSAQALTSGWIMFRWYFYFVFIALGVAVALVVVQLRRSGVLKRFWVPLGLVGLVVTPTVIVVGLKPDPWQVEIAAVAARLQTFSAEHPGVYAMGDAAGTSGWMINEPFVHLEGLMMSHDFIDRIRRREPLEQVFRDYHVTYYVAVWPNGEDENGCIPFAEPNPEQASPRAPHMTMTICTEPIEVIEPGSIFKVRIYRIDPATGTPA